MLFFSSAQNLFEGEHNSLFECFISNERSENLRQMRYNRLCYSIYIPRAFLRIKGIEIVSKTIKKSFNDEKC